MRQGWRTLTLKKILFSSSFPTKVHSHRAGTSGQGGLPGKMNTQVGLSGGKCHWDILWPAAQLSKALSSSCSSDFQEFRSIASPHASLGCHSLLLLTFLLSLYFLWVHPTQDEVPTITHTLQFTSCTDIFCSAPSYIPNSSERWATMPGSLSTFFPSLSAHLIENIIVLYGPCLSYMLRSSCLQKH